MYANVNGTKIFFDIEGLEYVPDGPVMRQRPVCFVLHGGPGGEHSHFLPAFSEMAKYMQLIYVDDRNCGRSERGDITKSTIKQNVEDIEALRKYLGLGKVFVYGHSYGGMKAQRYMIDHPESLYGVVLSDTAPDFHMSETTEQIVLERGTQEQIDAYYKRKLDRAHSDFNQFMKVMASMYNYQCRTQEQVEAVLDAENRCISNQEVNAYQYSHELNCFDFIPELKTTHVPTLILVGKYDHITPPVNAEKMHAAMPHSELHIIDAAAHECFCDRPDYVFPCVADFVKRNFKPE